MSAADVIGSLLEARPINGGVDETEDGDHLGVVDPVTKVIGIVR